MGRSPSCGRAASLKSDATQNLGCCAVRADVFAKDGFHQLFVRVGAHRFAKQAAHEFFLEHGLDADARSLAVAANQLAGGCEIRAMLDDRVIEVLASLSK